MLGVISIFCRYQVRIVQDRKFRRSQFIRLEPQIKMLFFYIVSVGPGWLNELGSWITLQLIQAYHQYGVGSHPTQYGVGSHPAL
jgi:hypothetical protein